jgi:tetratricopeptide (TPR) repeat protein
MSRPPSGSIRVRSLSANMFPETAAVLQRRVLVTALALALAPLMLSQPALADNASFAPRTGTGAPGMPEPNTASLLVSYYESFLKERDLERFAQQVAARYTEATLGRLIESGNLDSRRASVLALGLIGTFEASNAVVARALRDGDTTVRDFADTALWAIWYRADTAENNAMLEQVRVLIGQERLEDAVRLSTRLIARAPNFAEAYNQRAIAHFFQHHFQESADDCDRVLERNPYHFGALAGLARCQLQLDRRRDALKTFRRALRVQPFSRGFREAVTALEAEGE